MLFILSGTENEARMYLRQNHLFAHEARYLCSATLMRAYPADPCFVRIGTWADRIDLPDVERMILRMRAVEF